MLSRPAGRCDLAAATQAVHTATKQLSPKRLRLAALETQQQQQQQQHYPQHLLHPQVSGWTAAHALAAALLVGARGRPWSAASNQRTHRSRGSFVSRCATEVTSTEGAASDVNTQLAEELDILGDGKLLKRILVPAALDAEVPQIGDTATVHYIGTLASSGKEFDSSRSRGTPFKFRVGLREVIRGWDKGVATMRKGERAILTIDSELAYGETGAGSDIPPNSKLCFDVELLDIDEFEDLDDDDDDDDEDYYDDFDDLDLDNLDDGMVDADYGREDFGPGGEDPEGRYHWERKGDEVLVTASLEDSVDKKDIKAHFGLRVVSVSIAGNVLFEGVPGCELEPDESWWEINETPDGERCLKIYLHKKNAEVSRWPSTLLKTED